MMNTVNTEFSSVKFWLTDQVSKAHYKNEMFNRIKMQKIR